MVYTLVTGASSGIGYELARIFASHGHHLVLAARSKDKLDILKAELEKSYGVQVHVIEIDLAQAGSSDELFYKTEKLNLKIENLVNNAGFGEHGYFYTTNLKRIQEMIHLNMTTLTELTYLYLKDMLKNKSGRILNVASTAAFQPGPLMSVYYATKAYVLSFSEGLYEELKGTGISVTALCPGPTTSGFQAAANIGNIPLLTAMKIPNSFEVAEFGYKQMMKREAVAVHGFMNKVFTATVGLAPRSVVRQLVKKLQSKKVELKA